MNSKNSYLVSIFSLTAIAGVATVILFITNLGPIIKTINSIEGTWLVIGIITVRILLLGGMCVYMFQQWFQQEKQYLSDIPFLFSLFFLLIIFGKSFDLLYNLTYFYVDRFEFLVIIKLRYSIGVLNLLPMYYLSIKMIQFFLSLYSEFEKFNDIEFAARFRKVLLILIASIEMILIIIFLDDITYRIILPGIVIPSFFMIVIIFYLAHRNNRLSQANPLILAIGFGAYLISQVIRPIFHMIFVEEVNYVFFAELIDLGIYFIIFIGLVKKKR